MRYQNNNEIPNNIDNNQIKVLQAEGPDPSVTATWSTDRSAFTGLAGSLEKVARLQDRTEIRLDLPEGKEWLRCADLLREPYQFDQWRASLSDWLLDNYGQAPGRTTASYIMTWYFHMPAFLGALLLHHERRVPELKPEQMSFRLSSQRPNPDAIALSGDRFYCLPSDPESGSKQATVVANERALAAVLRARYVAHATKFISAYSTISPFGARTLWAAATDALDNCLWLAGKHANAEGEGIANAALVLDRKHAPLTSASTLQVTENPEGQREWSRRRESCCFSYLLPNEQECDSCPRICAKK